MLEESLYIIDLISYHNPGDEDVRGLVFNTPLSHSFSNLDVYLMDNESRKSEISRMVSI